MTALNNAWFIVCIILTFVTIPIFLIVVPTLIPAFYGDNTAMNSPIILPLVLMGYGSIMVEFIVVLIGAFVDDWEIGQWMNGK